MSENKELFTAEEKAEIEKDFSRLKELAKQESKTTEEVNEMLALERKIEELSEDARNQVHSLMIDKVKEIGNMPSPEQREKNMAEAADINQEAMTARMERQKKIREGISNTEAEEYVKGLVKENNAMKRELTLAKFENQALKANNAELITNIAKEAQEMKEYLSTVQNVVEVFSEKIQNVTELHKVVENSNDSESSSKTQ